MKPLIVILAASTVSSAAPPVQYQGEASAYVHFVRNVPATCPFKAPEGYTVKGWHQRLNGQSIIILPHPCAYPAEEFARIACHEIGHVNGWSGMHEQ